MEARAEFSRILAFSDGVFAIAITLLVLQLEVPETADDLGRSMRDELPDLFAFALSFAVLGRFWWRFHHRFFIGLEQFDGRLVGLNFVYLALVTLVPFTSEVLGDYGEEPQAVIVYAANIGLLGSVGALMIHHAFGNGLMSKEAVAERSEEATYSWWLMPIIFFGSIPVAVVSPAGAIAVWVAASVIMPRLLRRSAGGEGD
jgi:uncharacterized membrane protein